MEFSGTVVEVGDRVTMWRLGDRVMGIDAGGAYAERIAVHERQLLAVPDGIDLRRRGGDPRSVPDGVGRTGAAGWADQRAMGTGACRRLGRGHRGHPDRRGHRCAHRRHVLGRQGGGLPAPGCRHRARAIAARLADRCTGRSAGRFRCGARRDRWRRDRPQPAGRRAEGHHRAGRSDGWWHGLGERRTAADQAHHVGGHHVAAAAARGEGGRDPSVRGRDAAAVRQRQARRR